MKQLVDDLNCEVTVGHFGIDNHRNLLAEMGQSWLNFFENFKLGHFWPTLNFDEFKKYGNPKLKLIVSSKYGFFTNLNF